MASTESSTPGTRAERSALTRGRILEAALHLFAADGYAATSLQDIADAMGVAKAAVYYHYRTKQDILIAIMEPGFAAVEAVLANLESIPRTQRRDLLIEGFASVVVRQRQILFLSVGDPAIAAVPAINDRLTVGVGYMVRLLYGTRPTVEQRLAVAVMIAIPPIVGGFANAHGFDNAPEAQLRKAVVEVLRRVLIPSKVTEI